MSDEDKLRSTMIEQLMCQFELAFAALADKFDESVSSIRARFDGLTDRFGGYVEIKGNRLRITQSARLIARLVASELDTFKMPDGRHSRAL